MKINRRQTPIPPYKRLRGLRTGAIVNLKQRLSRDMETTDPFLVVDMQSYTLYAREHECAYGKVAVLNLNNNRLSYIDGDREVFEIDAEVTLL